MAMWISTETDYPMPDETVWFFTPTVEVNYLPCVVHNYTGWHLGHWDGKAWQSEFDDELDLTPGEVFYWVPLGVPASMRPSFDFLRDGLV